MMCYLYRIRAKFAAHCDMGPPKVHSLHQAQAVWSSDCRLGMHDLLCMTPLEAEAVPAFRLPTALGTQWSSNHQSGQADPALQVVPYVQAAAEDVAVAVDRAERVAACLPEAWARAGPLPEAQPLLSMLHSLARQLESQCGDGSAAAGAAAKRLAQVMNRLGDRERASRLLAAFKL